MWSVVPAVVGAPMSFQLMPRAVGGGRGCGLLCLQYVGAPVVLSADAKSSWRQEGVWSVVPAVGRCACCPFS